MSNKENQSKKRYYPLRDAKNPNKVTLIEITEAQYKALYPEIWATQKRERYHGRCNCPVQYNWKCDANCDLCEYHKSDALSLDAENTDTGETLADMYVDTSKDMESIISDKLLLEQLIQRFKELDPKAEDILALWNENDTLSDREIAKALGIPQRTFADHMKKYRAEFRKIRGH